MYVKLEEAQFCMHITNFEVPFQTYSSIKLLYSHVAMFVYPAIVYNFTTKDIN